MQQEVPRPGSRCQLSGGTKAKAPLVRHGLRPPCEARPETPVRHGQRPQQKASPAVSAGFLVGPFPGFPPPPKKKKRKERRKGKKERKEGKERRKGKKEREPEFVFTLR